MDQLNSTLRESFRNSSSSLEDVGNVLTGVTQSLHLTGQAAVDVTGQIDDLNRMTGSSLNIRGLGQALAAFGVDASQAGNALDMLYAASAKTGQPLNELLNNLVNTGPAARTLGLNLGELTNLFSKFEEGGINSSRAQQALNTAAKVFADANIPLETGLSDTITQIRGFIDAGNEAAAVDLAGKVFNTRGAQQFVDLIRQGKLTASDLNTEMTGTSGAIEQMNSQTRDWSENWQQLKNRATDLAEVVGGRLFDALNSALGVLNDLIDDLPAAIDGTLKIGQNLTSGAPMTTPVPFTPGAFLPGIPLPQGSVANPVPADAGALASQFPWLAPSLNLPSGAGDGRQPQDIAQAIEDAKNKAASGSGPSAPRIPYPADYGMPPQPGENPRAVAAPDADHRRPAHGRRTPSRADSTGIGPTRRPERRHRGPQQPDQARTCGSRSWKTSRSPLPSSRFSRPRCPTRPDTEHRRGPGKPPRCTAPSRRSMRPSRNPPRPAPDWPRWSRPRPPPPRI
jgi:ABC-type transporter Mla subunit MlaD